MAYGQPRGKRRHLLPEEKRQVFLEVTTGEISQADAARKWRVEVSTVIKVRKVAKDAALAAFARSRAGRPSGGRDAETEELRADNARLPEALKELAIELALVRGKMALGLSPGPIPPRASRGQERLLKLVDEAARSPKVAIRNHRK